MKTFRTLKICMLAMAAAMVLSGCGQPDKAASTDSPAASAQLDMSLGPNKVTADDYALTPVPSGDSRLASVNAEGQVAPFGMASRAKRPVQELAAVAPAAAASAESSGVFAVHCVACHGADAKGVEGLGLDLTASALVANSSTAELVAFLKEGRLPNSPDSVTGVPMPSFAWMPDADINEVANYLKSL